MSSLPSTLLARGSVLGITRQCAVLFGRGLSSQSLDKQSLIDLENQLGRFKIWAGNIGVFAAGNASIDFRLRNDPDIKEVMIQMLIRLRKSVEQIINPPLAETPSPEDSNSHSSSSSSTSSCSLALSLDASSEPGSIDQNLLQRSETFSYDRLQTVDNVITRLYRLSAVVRKPTSFSENVKVIRFIEKAQDGQEMEEYESHIRWQIQFRHSEASSWLVDRLVNAVVFRRKKLLYRERHQQKLNQGVDDAFMEDLQVPNGSDAIKPRGINTPIRRHNSPFLKVAATVKSSSPTVPFSATQASTINRRGMDPYAKSVAFSLMTKSAIARREQLDVPPPPQPEGETAEAICPYCFEIVDKVKMARALWTRHILKDIDPYICLFENCDKPDEHFGSVEEWLNHMKWQHTAVWFCPAPKHKSELFNSKIGLEQHMRREHRGDFTESQLPTLVQKCSQPSSDPFIALTLQRNEAASANTQGCPLCPFSVDTAGIHPQTDPALLGASDSADQIDKTLRNHVAAHLESIALLSLPEQHDLDNAASNELQSGSAKNSSRQEDNDLPPAVFIDDDPLALAALQVEVPWDSEIENWDYVYAKSRQRTDFLDPYQDPVLQRFLEEARFREITKIRQSLIPTIIVHDDSGFEVTEEKWAYNLMQNL